MSTVRLVFVTVVASVSVMAVGCDNGRRGRVEPAHTETGRSDGSVVRDVPRPEPESTEVTLRGRFTGRAVDPPLKELDTRMAVVPWHGEGEVEITAPREGRAEGVVSGVFRAEGFVLRLRGWRSARGIRAVIDQDTDAGEGVWRGMLDGAFEGQTTSLRGRWTVSSDGGRNVRGGTFEVH